MKTMVIISDTHCGSEYGLTPAKWFNKQSPHHYKLQKESWESYLKIVSDWERPDVLLVNGDCIEGNQSRQGGAELLTVDRNRQVDMAICALSKWNAKKILISFGTPYHTSSGAEDYEYVVAKEMNATIEGKLYFQIENMIVEARHKIGSSGVPQGRATSLLRAIAWNLFEACDHLAPRADIIIRSHVHYHVWVEMADVVAFTTPSLQLKRGRFGSRECEGRIDWGAIRLTLDNGQIIGKDVRICRLSGNKQQVLKIE